MSSFSMFQGNGAADTAQPAQPAQKQLAPHSGGSRQDSIIGSELVIIGDVKSSGGIRVDGSIQGDIDCASLVVNASGEVKGGVEAEKVVVHGRVTGSIRGRSVMLHATAKVEADIKHQGIGIEMGTRYDGTLRWVEDHELTSKG